MIRKHKKAAKIITTALAIVVMLGTFFVQNVFADSGFVYIPVSNSPGTNGVGASWTNSMGTHTYYYSASTHDVYGFIAPYSANTSVYAIYFVCDKSLASSFTIYSASQGSNSVYNSNISIVDDTNNLVYGSGPYTSSNGFTSDMTTYNTLQEGLNAFKGFVDNGYREGPVENGIVYVNPGNVAYIGYDSATFGFRINLNNPVARYNCNARYGFASTLPTGTFSFNPSSGNPLPLTKSIPDLLGRSATWVGHVETDTTGYFIVYNPVYDDNGNTNKTIIVDVVDGYINVTQFPLTATDVGGNIVSSGNSDNFYISDGKQGETDIPKYVYSTTDENGDVVTSSALEVPTTPYNYTSSEEAAENGIQGFIQKIIDLLSAPIKHIVNLYNSAVSFFLTLSSLWSWLPSEITSILISAVVVLIVVGVIKFLWK